MKQWIAFLIVPLLILWVLEFLVAIVVAGFFQVEHLGFWDITSTFIVYFCGGVALLHFAPNKKPVFAYVLGVIHISWGVYLGIETHGNVMEVLGNRVVQEFSLLQESARAIGLLLGVAGAASSEKEEAAAGS